MLKRLFLVCITVILISCSTDSKITFYNPLDSERIDEVLIISREELSEKTKLKEGAWPVFSFEGQVISSQVDDLDNDGNWDEVVLVTDFDPREEKRLEVDFLPPGQYPKFAKRTNLRLGILQDDGSSAPWP